MALLRYFDRCYEIKLPGIIAGLTGWATFLTFGSNERPMGSVLFGFASGVLFPVTLPGLVMYHLWQENKERILAKHHHKRKRELWVDDFLVDLDE